MDRMGVSERCVGRTWSPAVRELRLGLFGREAFRAPTWMTLVITVFASLGLAFWMKRDVERDAAEAFRFSCDQIQLKIAERLDSHRQVLKGAAGLFDASSDVSRSEWRAYVQRILADHRSVGVQGFGYSQVIPASELQRHIESVRKEGFPTYTVRPPGLREIYSAILFLEPFENRNLRAFGYDMFSEPVRHQAMARARDLNRAVLSGRVTLVQETDEDVQAGVLMYLPVYRNGASLSTETERRQALKGWVYSPFRMKDLLGGILGGWSSVAGGQIRLEVFDGPRMEPAHLLYDSEPGLKPAPHGRALVKPMPDSVLEGLDWTLRFSQGTRAGTLGYGRAWGALAGGLLCALLMTSLVAVFQDTRASARALLRSREMLARTEHLSRIGSWEWEAGAAWISCAEELYRLCERDPAAGPPTFQDFLDRCHPEDRASLRAAAEAAWREGQSYGLELRMSLPGGERVMLARGHAQRDAAGRVVRLFGFLQDVTEERQAEADRRALRWQLQQAHKLESLGSLASGVAHDMNNVLAAILGLASAHLEMPRDAAGTRRAFETIVKACERGSQLLGGLLNFARPRTVQATEVDLNALVRGAVELLERTTHARIRFDVQTDPALPPCHGDPDALGQALMNLCINAVDAMPEGGTLTLRTSVPEPGWLELRVKDTGQGMSQDVLEKAMDPFFTTKGQGKGTGLGLSMVFTILKAHQGRVLLESTPGRGTEATLRIPAGEARPSGEGPASPRGMVARPLHLLVVDDDPLVQASMEVLLGALGHRHTLVSSGEAALARLGEGLEVDAVVLDMNMPGLGGAGTLPRMRQLRPQVPVLLATGRPDATALALVEAHSGVTLLPKPFAIDELRARLGTVAGAH